VLETSFLGRGWAFPLTAYEERHRGDVREFPMMRICPTSAPSRYSLTVPPSRYSLTVELGRLAEWGLLDRFEYAGRSTGKGRWTSWPASMSSRQIGLIRQGHEVRWSRPTRRSVPTRIRWRSTGSSSARSTSNPPC